VQQGYTLEIYKLDRRCRTGEKLVSKQDYPGYSGTAMMDLVMYLRSSGQYPKDQFRLEFFETLVLRVNHISGVQFWERYDVPYFCSPRSETYWSM
jgi:hypothetical protein